MHVKQIVQGVSALTIVGSVVALAYSTTTNRALESTVVSAPSQSTLERRVFPADRPEAEEFPETAAFDLDGAGPAELEEAATRLSELRAELMATEAGRAQYLELEGRLDDAFAAL